MLLGDADPAGARACRLEGSLLRTTLHNSSFLACLAPARRASTSPDSIDPVERPNAFTTLGGGNAAGQLGPVVGDVTMNSGVSVEDWAEVGWALASVGRAEGARGALGVALALVEAAGAAKELHRWGPRAVQSSCPTTVGGN